MASYHIPVEASPDDGFLVPCIKLEELHLGDGFIEIPDAFICRVLDSVSSRVLSHLTIELSDVSRVAEETWKTLDEGLVRLWRKQEIGGRLAVEFSTPLPAEDVQGRIPRFRGQGMLFVGYRGRPSCW